MIAVLQALRDHPSGITGYQIKRLTKVNGPTVYNILRRFDADGWITSRPEPSPFRGSPDRKPTILTDLGKEKLGEVLQRRNLGGGLVGRG